MKPIWSMGNCTRKQWLTPRTKNQDHDVELEAAGYYLIEVFGAWIESRGSGWVGLVWFDCDGCSGVWCAESIGLEVKGVV